MSPANLLLTLALLAQAPADRAPSPPRGGVDFVREQNRVRIVVGDKPFAAYIYRDETVRRPFLAHVRAPHGVQVTRNHPPQEGQDATDHAAMHPGIWLAFGDLSGADFWRNRGAVEHVEFVAPPTGGRDGGQFAVRNRYVADGRTLAEETCRIAIRREPSGVLVLWDSAFRADEEFTLGDQEEMGLGVRVATPLEVRNGGRIFNGDRQENEAQVWGPQADWCAYEGEVDGRRAGIALMPHPENFRRSWFHARDYGLLVANPFGQNAFTGGEAGRVVVPADEPFRLRFGVLIYEGTVDGDAARERYLSACVVEEQSDGGEKP